MECIIPGNNMKVLGKALQALSKIGDELYVEAQTERLSFITLNSSKTVCSRFHFLDTFFSSYELTDSNPINCKVHMKILLPMFRNHLEKKLEYVKLEYTPDCDHIILKMKYKCDDLLMVHNLRLMDSQTLSIDVDTNSGPNTIAATSSFFNQLLATFNVSDDEVTFEINSSKIIVRNYCMGTPCRPKTMRSQINVNSTEFSSYRINNDTTINFSLKPFRTVVHFAENFNLDVELNFELGGKPLSILVKNPTFEVSFIVATLNPYADATPPSAACKLVTKSSDQDYSKSSESFVERSPPQSARAKKAKAVFGRCYDATFHETILGEVLAGNSDSE